MSSEEEILLVRNIICILYIPRDKNNKLLLSLIASVVLKLVARDGMTYTVPHALSYTAPCASQADVDSSTAHLIWRGGEIAIAR